MQQCPHEQPEETTHPGAYDKHSGLFDPDEYPESYPQVDKEDCMPTHDTNGQDSSDII